MVQVAWNHKKPETSALKEGLSALLLRAEKLVESHLSNVLRDFRQVGPGGQVPKKNAWFWNQSDERALKCALRSRCLLEASSILRRCAAKLQAWPTDGTPLVDLGITCHLHNCLAECHHLLEDDLEGPPVDSDSDDGFLDPPSQAGSKMTVSMEAGVWQVFGRCSRSFMIFWNVAFQHVSAMLASSSQVSSLSRGLSPRVFAKSKLQRRCTEIGFATSKRGRARSLSAPPKFGIQEEQNSDSKEGQSLDDSSLDLLHVGVPKLASMDPRNILKRFYASLVGEGKSEGEIEQPTSFRAISTTSCVSGGDTWLGLCAEPRKVLESLTGHSETYNLTVPCGVQGMAVPLPTSLEQTDDLGAVIAHALLSLQHWEQLRPHLEGHCLGELDEDLVVISSWILVSTHNS